MGKNYIKIFKNLDLIRIAKSAINIFYETRNVVVALPILGLSKDFKTKCCQAEEFRVSTIKESAHVNMSLFILKILLRGVVLSSRKFEQ